MPTVVINFQILFLAWLKHLKRFNDGFVLIFNAWGDPNDPNSMFWLDQPPNGPCPIYTNPDPKVTFGNVRVGPIGSTTGV